MLIKKRGENAYRYAVRGEKIEKEIERWSEREREREKGREIEKEREKERQKGSTRKLIQGSPNCIIAHKWITYRDTEYLKISESKCKEQILAKII